jgi:hypothetical protein
MKNFCKLVGIIAVVTIIGFSMIACDDGSGNGGDNGTDGNNGNGIDVGQLPEFPSGSTPAGTKTDAEAILAELRKFPILDSIDEEIWEVINENRPDRGNYSFSNLSLPDGFVKVSASRTSSETNTGGFQTLSANRKAIDGLLDDLNELYADYSENNETEIQRLRDEIQRLVEEKNDIQFASGDRDNWTGNGNEKGELTRAKTENSVTVAQGSTFERKYNGSSNITVSTAGTYTEFRMTHVYSEKQQTMAAFTVTTSSGSVKVILDMNEEWSGTGNNVKYFTDNEADDDLGTWTGTVKYFGSLKVYGSNNALLIDHRIVDRESYNMAQYMISYDPYSFNPTDAAPLTSNVKVNGNISSPGSAALYSINVTSGTKYHLWWNDSSNSDGVGLNLVRVRVRGYYGNGTVFFDTDGDWNLDWVNYYSFTAASSGTVYIMVYPDRRDDTGTFAIVYNTAGNRPAMSVSFIAPFSANSRSVQNITDPVGMPQKAIGVLRHNRNLR